MFMDQKDEVAKSLSEAKIIDRGDLMEKEEAFEVQGVSGV